MESEASKQDPSFSGVAGSNTAAEASGNKSKKRSNPATAATAAAATGVGTDSKASKKKKKDANVAAAPKKKKKKAISSSANVANMSLIEQVMYRLTEGIPRMELKAAISEADQCEKELQEEIRILEAALKEEVGPLELSKVAALTKSEEDSKPAAKETTKEDTAGNNDDKSDQQTVNLLLESPFTPLDKCFTLSALLGRLRDDLAIPSIRKPPPAMATAQASKKKKSSSNTPPVTYPRLVSLASNPNYTRIHPDPPAQLLHVWRKIASHRTAMVFRRPVRPEEAPGYTERILFPMDLSLVRKMIVARMLTSYAEVHQKIRLISHNCVKYNGRESDYGIVAREFEAAVDEYIAAASNQTPQQAATAAANSGKSGPLTKAQSGKASGRNSPKSVGGSGASTPMGGASGRGTPVSGNSMVAAQQPPSASAISAATEAAAAAVASSTNAQSTAGKK